MTPQELKNSILQLAIQGRLVEQRPEEGTAEELYREIQAEKQRLIKAGKLKREKPLPEITEGEKPFEIPESWMWVRLGHLIVLLSGQDLLPAKYNNSGEGIPYITGASNIAGAEIIINRWTQHAQAIAHRGDLLLTCKGTVGKTAVLNQEAVHIARQIMAITPIAIDTMYLKYFIESQISQLKSQAKSMIPGIERANIINLPYTLPPLAEQKRIVSKIEELLPYIDRYEQAWMRLEAFNQRFPDDMRKSILQLAIQGKLVEQRPEEGTGDELYREIQAEKQRLIKAGKIKAEKPLPEIGEDEKPFEIPESWKWVRFGEFGSYKKGPFGSALTKSMFVPKGSGTIKVYEQKNAIQKDSTLGNYYITKAYFEAKMQGFEVLPGDIIVSCAGTIGETYILPENCERGIINQALMRMRLFAPVYLPYFLVFFDFVLKKSAQNGSNGSAIKNIPPFEALKKYLVPLPPLAEQKRIVARLEELLAVCEKLLKR